jgi:hypothetical protein
MHSKPAVCYDIRSCFTRSPELKVCPVCGQDLRRTQTRPSIAGRYFAMQASIPLIETEWLRCAACGWWAIREICTDCELDDGCIDLLMVPYQQTAARPSPQVLEQALEDDQSWKKSCRLSRTQAQRLFGPLGPRNPAKRIKNTR